MRVLTLALMGAFLVACGGDDGGSKVELDANQMQQVKENSTNTVEAGVSLGELKTNPTADDPISKLTSIFSYSSSLWSTKMTAAYAGGSGVPGYPLEAFEAALTDGCVTESGGTITYDCNDYGYAINGTVTVSGDTITIDLSYEGNGVSFTYKGSVTVTDTSIDGSIDFSYMQDQGGQSFTYDIGIDYNAITLDATGCPIAGSLAISVDVSGAAMGGYDVDYPNVRIDFGPACGDVAMF